MVQLTDAQLATLRRDGGTLDLKELAKRVELPRHEVEAALAELGEVRPVWRAREPWAWSALGALLIVVAGLVAYGGNARAGFHYDDNHAIEQNEAISTLRIRTEEQARSDDSPLRRVRNFVRSLGPTAEAIYRFNHYRMVTYWSFALDEYLHGKREPQTKQDPFTNRPPAGWHTTSNLIHVLNGLLVLWVAWLTLTAPVFARAGNAVRHPRLVALIAALIFVLHPMQTQAVTYLSQRAESLCATFYLLALGCYAAARIRSLARRDAEDAPRAPWLTGAVLGGGFLVLALAAVGANRTELIGLGGFVRIALLVAAATAVGLVVLVKQGFDERGHALLSAGCFAAFLLGLESKEVAATLPVVLVLWELLFVPRARPGGAPSQPWLLRALRGSDLERVRALGPWAVIVGAVALLTLVFGGGVVAQLMASTVELGGQSGSLSAGDYLLTQANVLLTYGRLFVLPTRLHLDHDYPTAGDDGSGLAIALSLLALAAMVGLALWRAERARVPAFALLAGLVILAPTSSVVALPDVIYEHRFYLPLFGAALTAAVLAERALRAWLPAERHVPALWGLALLVAVVLAGATRARNAVWADELSLWQDVTAKSPDKPRGWVNLGLAYQAREPHRVVLDDGRVLWGEARALPAGVTFVRPTSLLKAKFEVLPSDRITVEPGPGGPEPTREAYERALALDPGYTKALNNLALVWVHTRERRLEEGTFVLEQLVPRLQREGPRAAGALRECQEHLGALEREMEAAYRKAQEAWAALTEARPEDPIVWNNRANLALTVGRYADAAAWMEIALAKGCPPDGWAIRGDALYLQGDAVYRSEGFPAAQPLWQAALECYHQYLLLRPTGQFVEHVRKRVQVTTDWAAGRKLPDPSQPAPQPSPLPGR